MDETVTRLSCGMITVTQCGCTCGRGVPLHWLVRKKSWPGLLVSGSRSTYSFETVAYASALAGAMAGPGADSAEKVSENPSDGYPCQPSRPCVAGDQ